MFKDNPQKATTLYLSLIIVSILLGIALGMSSIFLGQTRMLRIMGYSVIAFYAADVGIEEVLMQRADPVDIPQTALSNGATYQVLVVLGGAGDCAAVNFCIKSIGTYQEVNRAIEIMY